MTVVLRFDPFRELDRLTEAVAAELGDARSGRRPRLMPMDLYRLRDHYVLHADMPGADPGSIEVKVDNGLLTIQAERTLRTEGEDVQWLASERGGGTFLRQLQLGDGLDQDRLAATYENGVLTVTLPIAEQAKPRKVAVNYGSAPGEGRVLEASTG